MIARLRRLLGHRQRLLDGRGTALPAAQALDELPDLAFGQGTDKTVDRPAVLEGVDCRNRLDTHLLSDFGVLVDIELDHPNGAIGGADGLFQDRSELFTGTAPRCPEIDDHRHVERAVDDFGHEIGGSYVLHRGGSRAADQRFAGHRSSLRFWPTTWRQDGPKTSAGGAIDRVSSQEYRAGARGRPDQRSGARALRRRSSARDR